MRIDEAIEIIKTFLPPIADGLDPDEIDAIQLGIEALQAFKLLRNQQAGLLDWLLPGETEEVK